MLFYAIRDELKAHAIAAVLFDRALPNTIHTIVEAWLLCYQHGQTEAGDCKSLADNIIAAARRKERKRCMAAQCCFCAMGWKAEDKPGWGYYHFNADGGPDQKCAAAAIRALLDA